MSAKRVTSKLWTASCSGLVRALLTVAVLGPSAGLAGCNKAPKPEAEQPKTTEAPALGSSAGAGNAAAEQAPPPAQSSYDEPNFALSIKPPPAVHNGQASQAEIELVAKGPFHVNQSYPYKFKVRPNDGIKTDKPVVSSDGVKLENKRALMNVGFTASSAGKKTLAGQFSFSVCTDDKCLIEKRELALSLDVQ